MKYVKVVSWVLRLVVAAILLQTLFFKFTGAAESVAIFSDLGVEPFGRIGSGIVELIASVLLFIPGMVFWGASLAALTMLGAIGAHVFVLTIAHNDGGVLFTLASIVFVCSVALMFIHKKTLLALRK